MRCEGHSHVFTNEAKHAYEEQEAEEYLEFSYNDNEVKIGNQITRRLEGQKIDSFKSNIERVDPIVRGDHGHGAFQTGAQVVIPFSMHVNIPTLVFDISIGEVICRKENTQVKNIPASANKRMSSSQGERTHHMLGWRG